MTDRTTVQRHRPIDESYRTFGGVRTRVLTLAGEGAPLVCFHGYSDLADTWRPLMRALRGANRHVIAVDLPGFGHASPLAAGPVLPQLDGFVAEVIRTTAAEAGQAAYVVGNSLGAIAALRAGTDHSLPIAGLIPISPAGFGHSKAIKFVERHEELTPLLQRGLLPMPMVRGVMTVAFRRASCGSLRHADRDAVKAYAGQFRTRADMQRIFGIAGPVLAEISVEADLTSVKVPVLLLWGDRDRLTLHRGSARVMAAIPHTELVTLHGYGHCPQLEAAPRIARHINDFVARHTALSIVGETELE